MKLVRLWGLLGIALMIGKFTIAQSVNITSNNGSTASIDLNSIETIVFTNNSLVFNNTTCNDNYFSVFFTEKLFFGESVSQEDFDAQANSILVYPNPATDALTIVRSSGNHSEAFIINVLGGINKRLQLSELKSTVDISELPAGVYLISIDNQLIKFIKQ